MTPAAARLAELERDAVRRASHGDGDECRRLRGAAATLAARAAATAHGQGAAGARGTRRNRGARRGLARAAGRCRQCRGRRSWSRHSSAGSPAERTSARDTIVAVVVLATCRPPRCRVSCRVQCPLRSNRWSPTTLLAERAAARVRCRSSSRRLRPARRGLRTGANRPPRERSRARAGSARRAAGNARATRLAAGCVDEPAAGQPGDAARGTAGVARAARAGR